MKFAQLVIGPAGCGKSTYCETIKTHCDSLQRTVHCVNLDPAAEEFRYNVTVDVRDLVTLEDVMEELELGPNGGLMYCMDYLEENLDDWWSEQLESFGEDDYLLIDCPGQIELYSQRGPIRAVVDWLKADGWNVAAVYCLDAAFAADAAKYVSGCLAALSAMTVLELPHINVLTKVDLLPTDAEGRKAGLEEKLIPEPAELLWELQDDDDDDDDEGGGTEGGEGKAAGTVGEGKGEGIGRGNRAGSSTSRAAPPTSWAPGQALRRRHLIDRALVSLLDTYGSVGFVPLDISDEESVNDLLIQIDQVIQYGEDQEVRTTEYGDFPDEDEE